MWEAFQHAGWEGLDNLTAIIDVNRLGQTRETMLGWDLDGYVRRIEAFGWKAIAIDGHDVDAIEAAYAEAEATTGPADGDRRAHEEGQGRARRSRTSPASTASRSTTPRRRSRSSAASATSRSTSPSPRPASRTSSTSPARSTPLLRARRGGRDAQGLRRVDRRAGAHPRRRRRARRRGLELDALRGLPRGAPGPLLRDVHRRAAARRGGGRDAGARLDAVRVHVRGVPLARVRLRPHGRDLAREARAERLARRRLDRRGRAVADGAGGHRLAARDPRLDRPAPERRQPDREAGRGARRPRRASRSSARCAARRPCARAAGEDVRIGGSRIAHEGDDVAIIACGITRRRGGQGRRAARRRRRARARARRLLDQADRRARPSAPPRASAARSSPSRTTPRRAASATPCSRRWPRATSARTWSSSRCARCPTSGTPEELLHGAKIDADAIADAAGKLVAAPA